MDELAAEEMIAFAEEAAEQVSEEEEKRPREEARQAPQAVLKPSAAARAAELFSDAGEVAPTTEEPKQTVESLFGPGAMEKPEPQPTLSAAEVFGERLGRHRGGGAAGSRSTEEK